MRRNNFVEKSFIVTALSLALLVAPGSFPFFTDKLTVADAQDIETYSVSGSVTTYDGAGLEGVTISFGIIPPNDIEEPPLQITTDSNGQWSQAGFKSKYKYRLAISKSGYEFYDSFRDFSSPKSNLNFRSKFSIIFPTSYLYLDRLLVGTDVTIRWSPAGLNGNVRIELTRDGGRNWEILSEIPNEGKVVWQVTGPSTLEAKIRVTHIDTEKSIQSNRFEISEAQVKINLSVPFVHQIHDALPDFRGHWACGATSVVMIAASYGKLVPMFSPGISPYGYYLSSRNTDEVSTAPDDVGTRIPLNLNEKSPTGPKAFGAYGYIHYPTGALDPERAKDYF